MADSHSWVTIRLPARDKHRLRVLAAQRDMGVSELVRELVSRALELALTDWLAQPNIEDSPTSDPNFDSDPDDGD